VSILLDTNILLRRAQPSHPSHARAIDSVARLLAAGEAVHFTLQNIAEFWNVATRPAEHNGFGFSAAVAVTEVEKIEAAFELLPDTPALYAEWRGLVLRHGVIGAKVHDARLVAAMKVHGVRRLLTFNAADFTRYPTEVLQPETVLSETIEAANSPSRGEAPP
jgi:predicted nucleic acid-binding protein